MPLATIIALLTDFGVSDPYVGVLKGVIAELAPQARVIDLTHNIPHGDLRRGAFVLWQSSLYFPEGTIFLCVVDPGVGTSRPAVALSWPRYWYVGPDNGLVSYLILRDGEPGGHELANPAFQLERVSNTFHGRDLFAPAAAHLACGADPAEMGPPTTDLARVPPPRLELWRGGEVAGEILHADAFGNLITSVGALHRPAPAEPPEGSPFLHLHPWLDQCPEVKLTGDGLSLRLPDGQMLPVAKTFADVPPGDPLAYIGSNQLLEIGVNQGNASETLALSPGDEVVLTPQG